MQSTGPFRAARKILSPRARLFRNFRYPKEVRWERRADQKRGAIALCFATEGNGVRAANPPLLNEPQHHSPLPSGPVGSMPNDGLNTPTHRPAPPADCRRILIVGAGGFGREVLQWARDAWPRHAARLAGFLSNDARVLDGFEPGLSILDSPENYRPLPGDFLLLAIGVPYVRRQVAESLLARGAEFLTLVHPTAVVAASATIGAGSILCPYAIVSDSASLGRFALLNYHASIGHDASAGDYTVLSPYATLGGHAQIEPDVFMGLHASVGPGKRVGARSKVSANSCALANAPADSIVFGAPGRTAPLIR